MNTNNTFLFDTDKPQNGDVVGIPFFDYLDWAAGEKEKWPLLSLPVIQRGFVWKPKQIAELWDSLLSGLPIGGMMISCLPKEMPSTGMGKVREINNKDSSNVAWGLFDGQQRTISMLIGIGKGEFSDDKKLWVYLSNSAQAPKVRLSTRTQPFGFGPDHNKLLKSEKHQARESYDSDKTDEIKTLKDYELWKLGKEIPLPWWKGGKDERGGFIELPCVIDAFKSNRESCENFKRKIVDKIKGKSQDIKDENICALFSALCGLFEMKVPLTVFQPSGDYSEKAALFFQRMGINGTRLSDGDLLFAILKNAVPGLQNAINEACSDKNDVRYFMSPLNFVLTSFRFFLIDKADTDKKADVLATPNPDSFTSYRKKMEGSEELSGWYNKSNENGLKKLTDAFSTLKNILIYDKNDNPNGLPVLFMPHLSRLCLDPLIYFIVESKLDPVEKKTREAMIAYCLYWFIHCRDEDRCSRIAMEVFMNALSENKSSLPVDEFYKRAVSDQEIDSQEINSLLKALPLYDASLLISAIDDNTLIPAPYDPFPIEDIEDIALVNKELLVQFSYRNNKRAILLWLQREYVSQFLDSSQPSIDEDAVPYDYDHLCPHAHWGADWRVLKNKMPDKDLAKAFESTRFVIGDLIGNIHILESSMNRSCSDITLQEKIKHLDEHHKIKVDDVETKWSKDLSFISLSDNDISSFSGSKNNDNKAWDKDRVDSFQKATYKRTIYLYNCYVDFISQYITPNSQQSEKKSS